MPILQILGMRPNRFCKISDGVDVTERCFIGPEMKEIEFLSYPVVRVLQWCLQDENIKIIKYSVVRNSRNFPVLGLGSAQIKMQVNYKQQTLKKAYIYIIYFAKSITSPELPSRSYKNIIIRR